ncbi:MAG: archaemetzincin family Zn-dependent metalloprotease [Candidatus Bathyarchaeia archaeon]
MSREEGCSLAEPLRLVRVGAVDEEILRHLQNKIASALRGLEPEVWLGAIQPPREAFNAARRQFSSAKLLQWAQGLGLAATRGRTLLVTAEDLYVPGLNFVFGQARYPGRLAVISLHRLKPAFYGAKASPELLLERALKEAVHELGHTYGLGHCQDAGCVMRFSNSIYEVDAKTPSLCPRCAELLANVRRG